MADTSETQTSSSDDAEDFMNDSTSQPLLQLDVCSAGSVSANQEPEVADAGLHSLKHKRKKVNPAVCVGPSSENPFNDEPTADASTSSGKSGGPLKFPKPKLDLRALFDYHFRRKQHRYRKRWRLEEKPSTEHKSQKKKKKRLRVKLTIEERKRRYYHRGYPFSFVKKLYTTKHLPLRLVCSYEQSALEGYFRYIKMLKCEHHLKKSLTELDAGDELENECLESRKYKYLDDDGPLSPIEETNGDEQSYSGEEDIGVKIVEKSSFILNSTIPKKRKSKKY